MSTISGQEHSYFAFGELYLPLILPDMQVPLVHQFSLTGALRRENYNSLGGVTTTEIGLVYAPSPDFDFKASWGKSFKTPTLLQVYQERDVYLDLVSTLGATGYPSDATSLTAYGGNRNLQPERATTWTATLGFHPRALPKLSAELSYFHIDYRNRVAQGIDNLFATFVNPVYRQFINFNPTLEQQQELINSAGPNFFNFAGVAYDPADVVAIIDDLYNNIQSQRIQGVDLYANYRSDWGMNSLILSGSASWLESRQQNGASTPVFDLAGTLYYPPHWRSRFGATWEHGALTLSAFYNFIGGVTDITSTPPTDIDSMQTVDLTGIYHFPDRAGWLHGVDLVASVQNLANERPPDYESPVPFLVNYDSTNYSPVGRFVSIAITKRWP